MENNIIKKWQGMFPDSFLQTFPDNKKDGGTLCKALSSTTQEECNKLNKVGAGIFFSPNGFDSFAKRSEGACTKVNWWYVDIEGYAKSEQQEKIREFPLRPTMVIETKNGYHVYWKINGTSIHWHKVILNLIDFFSSDVAISSLNEVLRIPTFLHQKDATPFRIELKKEGEESYTEEQMFKALPKKKIHEQKYDGYLDFSDDTTLDEIKDIPIESVLDAFGVMHKRGTIYEDGVPTSAKIWRDHNCIKRFSEKPGSGTAIDVALTWGGASSVSDAIEMCCDKFNIHRKVLEKKAETITTTGVFSGVTDVIDKITADSYLVEDKDILEFGFPAIDEVIGGIFPDMLTVIGARSGHGKSEFCRYIASNAAKKGKKVYYFDLENSVGDFFHRELKTTLAQYDVFVKKTDLRRKAFWAGEHAELAGSILGQIKREFQGSMKLYTRTDLPTFDEFLAFMEAVTDADLIIIDHLHYFRYADNSEQHQQISEVMLRIKNFTRAKQVPVILAAHVKNPSTERAPMGSDLFGSSNIEKQTDVLIMPYKLPQEKAYKVGERKVNTKVFIRKNRPNAVTEELEATFSFKQGRITEVFNSIADSGFSGKTDLF